MAAKTPHRKPEPRRLPTLKSCLLVLVVYLIAGFALFGPFLDNPFLMDDEIQVTHNVHIQNIDEWQSYFTSSTMDSGGSGKMGGIYFKPFMTIYFATIWHWFGEDAQAFRVPLLLMQVFSALFIFMFLARFFDWPIAFAAGLIFVVHPINSEIVAYIADAQDALYMFFGLLGLTAFTLIRRTWLASLVLGLMLMSALLGKETGALFLAIVPMAAFFFDRPKFRASLLTAIAVAGVYAVLRVNSGLLTYEHRVLLVQQASYLERLMTIPLILWHYIEISFFPLRISLVTDFVIHSLSLEQFWLPLLGVGAFAGLLSWLWKSLSSDVEKKLFLFSMGILLLWFLLHGSILLPLDGTYADRWFYLGAWALLILCSLAVRVLFEHVRNVKVAKRVTVAIVAIFFVGATARTYVRLQDWETPMNLYQREFAQRPFDALMANNVGFEYFHRGEIQLAATYFQKATENNPVWDVAWNNLGATAQRLQDIDRALELYKKSVSLGTYYLAYENYAALLCMRRVDDECRDFLKKALALLPQNPKLKEIDTAINH